ncbi:MAG: NADH-quinone oxidoreductase subunit NuoF [Bacillota bacterium]|nr:NADH-quinone oxidoreductase subunit NuoF [Bacillota bacterium]HOB90359.1 NADH-quinone oxidoreductase subunit NuoF [Bacillota bacterium]HPZ53901.1 NADH-quinone oxidoreductase subunit NuoF [Bacillota bacterium]HQD17410.1 NADH-quinone oxidoreductase subunit NuoF [Bacillota bacterium]
MDGGKCRVLVCAGAGCVSSGCKAVARALSEVVRKSDLDGKVEIVQTGCIGSCDLGPVVVVESDGTFYQHVTPEDVPDIVNDHIIGGNPVERLLHRSGDTGEFEVKLSDMSFFRGQTKIALRNCGVIDPLSIDEYIARNGYEALSKVLKDMTPGQVIDAIKASGLRGRGGAGFPTGLKWMFTADAPGEPKYVVCNADEGDPGAFMDRSLLEGDPHSIIEAMIIAGYAVGSHQGLVYVRAEYPLAVERLSHAIEQAAERGFLGNDILGSGFSFNLEVRVGAGAFVCGEETALLASIEGKRGMPRPKPPFPAASGLWGKPTLINNVETFANIAPIILNGPEWFKGMGTDRSPGTKVFALAGNINNTGLVEVPMGTPLRTIIYEIGGGIPGGKGFKAAQTGGPSGGCIPAQHLDVPMDFDSLTKLGAMMGSGGLIVMDEETCMVDIAKFFLQFTQDESCGKCVPCREGTKVMLDILDRITKGEGQEGDIELLESLGKTISQTALCGLGQSAPNPVLSTIRYFRDEYEAHVRDKRCPAGVCTALASYVIEVEKCRGCGLCVKVCPVDAIHPIELQAVAGDEGRTKRKRPPYAIDASKCIKCGACVAECRFGAITR